MGLLAAYGELFQKYTPIPKIPNIPKNTPTGGQEGNSRDCRDFRNKVSTLKTGQTTPPVFDLPPQGEPLPCLHCFCWTPKPGSAWWAGECSVSGRAVTAKSTCDRGLEDWQATPHPQAGPQTPQEARK